MQYVQLYALEQGATGYVGYKELDLYPQEPIKITKSVLSLDDITSNKSAFSRTFRVPHTSSNGLFFKSVFNVNSINFDATRRTAAYILVDGMDFVQGNIQLMAIFRNDATGKIEYEITFLGTTSAFATEIAAKDMSILDLSDLSHSFTYNNIVKSWQPGATGLLNGDIIYPLAEYGYTYTSTKIPEQSTVSKYNATTAVKGFTNVINPLEKRQLRPAIRVKAIWDAIFADTNFTYTSSFVNNTLNRLYYMGSNYASPYVVPDVNFRVNTAQGNFLIGGLNIPPPRKIPTGAIVNNYSNAWDTTNKWYRVPISNLTYNFEVRFEATANWTNTPPNPSPNFNIELRMTIKRAGNIIQTINRSVAPNATLIPGLPKNVGFTIGGAGSPSNWPIFTGVNLQRGDICEFYISNLGNAFTGGSSITPRPGGYIDLVSVTPNVIDPSGFMPQQYKQLEFIKAINDRFKLVWEPDKDNPNNFLIEPYNDWVLGGEQKDWTDKLNEANDVTITPLFYSQPREIIFKDSEEGDLYNKNYQDQYKETFGQYNVDSGIELITGTKEIKSLLAPLPLAPIGAATQMLVPHFAIDTESERQPMNIKPRIGFYNGLQNVPDSSYYWWLLNDTGTAQLQTKYPVISSFDTYPFNSASFDLNWLNSPQFWQEQYVGFDGRTNITAYTQFWENWWTALYDPYSRLMEATFALDVEDVTNLSFNDKIFVKDSWWLVLEIQDFVLNAKNNVKVKLLKLGNLGINITGGSSGIKRFLFNDICYSTNLCEACCCLGYSQPIYTDNEDFASSTNASYDAAGQQPVLDGYYYDGADVFYYVGGNIVSSSSCAACVPCGATGLTEFNAVCIGDSFCEVCCCTSPEGAVWGNGASLDTSTRVFSSAMGGGLTPGKWYRNVGDGAAIQVGPDGTTVLSVAICSSCICNPLEDKSEFVIGNSSLDTCCVQAPGSYGVQSVYTNTGNLNTATAFYYDPYEQFPIAGTGSIYVSNGQTYVEVNGATAGATGSCSFPATGCTGRNEILTVTVENISGTATEILSNYYISFDQINEFYNGSDFDSGSMFTNVHQPTYATGSYFRYEFTVPSPYTGVAGVLIQENGNTIVNEFPSTPASYTTSLLGPIGANTYTIDVTWNP